MNESRAARPRRFPSVYAMLLFLLCPGCVEEVQQGPHPGEGLKDMYVAGGDYLVWRKIELAEVYTKILVQPLQFKRFHLPWYRATSGPALLKNRAAYQAAMHSVLGSEYPFVDKTGPGTIRVSAALTDRITHPRLLQVLRSRDRRVEESGNIPTVAMEIDFYDGETGELIAVIASVAQSHLYRRNLQRPPSHPILQMTYQPYAKRLKAALDQDRWSALNR